ncbi:MAG: tRNA dihydrouridine(20/20a) synthase DusA [Betaproteobacteria bacterium]|nr:tRNA dihydrouridine(20/20a) synthase DusA [Betaproteobacteria bacterium]
MMDWSDRHCRYYFRQLAPHAVVFTEMVPTGALLHGDIARHLDFRGEEHPVALQLGGSEPVDLAHCAKLGEQWGYDEVNLNCGCPSERVQRGAFGACLMAEPTLVADCVKAMCDSVSVPVSVKHRLGIDHIEAYEFVRDFVGTVAAAGCRTFIVHARNAVLKGLSPKDNRSVPPLKYDYVYRLKREFPELEIVINGGLDTLASAQQHLAGVDGVMLGRAAYHHSFLLARLDSLLFPSSAKLPTRDEVLENMLSYADEERALGTPLRAITRHLLGLYHGQPGARNIRRLMSDSSLLAKNSVTALRHAISEFSELHDTAAAAP